MPELAKRKKTADMPDSPPKRVTRSRAKASNDVGTKPKTVKVMTPSAKAIIDTKKTTEPAKTTKRKTRTDDAEDKVIEEQVVEKGPEDMAKTRGRTRKTDKKGREEAVTAQVPRKTRGRQTKAPVEEEAKVEAPKPRGRTLQSQNTNVEAGADEGTEKKLGLAKRTTRTRAATARADPPAASTLPMSSAPKKVKFQEDAEKDKENMPMELKKPVSKSMGLKARPMRKPAAAKATTRGRKAASSEIEAKTPSLEDNARPLTPKKVKQVAKSSSISSEDELCGGMTPARALSRSPVKPPHSSLRRVDGVASELEFPAATAPLSPISTVLQSPARRPPQSPFKDALKQSPKKGYLGDSHTQPFFVASHSPFRNSMKDSPKRGLASLSLKPTLFSQTPLKASLLQSPARRPLASAIRDTMIKSPSKASSVKPLGAPATPTSSPPEACSSPLRAARTPDQPFKVHTVSNPFGDPVAEPTSPDPFGREVAPYGGTSPEVILPGIAAGEDSSQLVAQELEDSRSCTPTPLEGGGFLAPSEETGDLIESTTVSPQAPPTFVAPAFSLSSPAFRCRFEESDSEDELASPQKVFLNTPLLKQGVSTKDTDMQSADISLQDDRRATLRSNQPSLAMTPLAVKLSTWLASSPEKKSSAAALQPVQLLVSGQEVSIEESPPKASFFDDEMAALDPKGDSSSESRSKNGEQDLVFVQTSQESQASEEYGDENAMPIDPQLNGLGSPPQDQAMTCTPAKVFYAQPREIHTVSKVPLRPAADDSPSPLKVARKRSRSLAGSSIPVVGFKNSRDLTLPLDGQSLNLDSAKRYDDCSTPVKYRSANDDLLIMETPRTLRKSAESNSLKGAVVYVDVHTTEGEDASGIFLELLAQLGARCVKQWSWNPRASLPAPAHNPKGGNENDIAEPEVSNNKVGITHVVYKDGGKRTLEKVRASKGRVHCVGVGWVLE